MLEASTPTTNEIGNDMYELREAEKRKRQKSPAKNEVTDENRPRTDLSPNQREKQRNRVSTPQSALQILATENIPLTAGTPSPAKKSLAPLFQAAADSHAASDLADILGAPKSPTLQLSMSPELGGSYAEDEESSSEEQRSQAAQRSISGYDRWAPFRYQKSQPIADTQIVPDEEEEMFAAGDNLNSAPASPLVGLNAGALLERLVPAPLRHTHPIYPYPVIGSAHCPATHPSFIQDEASAQAIAGLQAEGNLFLTNSNQPCHYDTYCWGPNPSDDNLVIRTDDKFPLAINPYYKKGERIALVRLLCLEPNNRITPYHLFHYQASQLNYKDMTYYVTKVSDQNRPGIAKPCLIIRLPDGHVDRSRVRPLLLQQFDNCVKEALRHQLDPNSILPNIRFTSQTGLEATITPLQRQEHIWAVGQEHGSQVLQIQALQVASDLEALGNATERLLAKDIGFLRDNYPQNEADNMTWFNQFSLASLLRLKSKTQSSLNEATAIVMKIDKLQETPAKAQLSELLEDYKAKAFEFIDRVTVIVTGYQQQLETFGRFLNTPKLNIRQKKDESPFQFTQRQIAKLEPAILDGLEKILKSARAPEALTAWLRAELGARAAVLEIMAETDINSKGAAFFGRAKLCGQIAQTLENKFNEEQLQRPLMLAK